MKIVSRGSHVERAGGKAHNLTELETDDGRHWRECLGPELAPDKLTPETLIYFGRGEPHQAGEFAGYEFPGGHPYLHGLCLLGIPVYIERERKA